MAFELSRIVGGAVSRVTRGGPTAALANPIIAAMVVTVIVFVIFFSVLRDHAQLSEAPWRARIQCGVYVFIGASLVLALSYYGIGRKYKSRSEMSEREGVISQIHNAPQFPTQSSMYVPVIPGSVYGAAQPHHAAPPQYAAPQPQQYAAAPQQYAAQQYAAAPQYAAPPQPQQQPQYAGAAGPGDAAMQMAPMRLPLM